MASSLGLGLFLSWLDECGFLRMGAGDTQQTVPFSCSLLTSWPILLVLPETKP